MRNSIAAGRRLAIRIVFAQSGASFLAAVLFLIQGWRSAFAAFCGGMVVVVSSMLLALRLFATTNAQASYVLVRLFAGLFLKWMVVISGMYLVMGVFLLPPLPALCGLIIALMAHLASMRFER